MRSKKSFYLQVEYNLTSCSLRMRKPCRQVCITGSKRRNKGRKDRLNLLSIPWKILFFMLRMGMEMTFAQNCSWEMGFTPHLLPLQDSCYGNLQIAARLKFVCNGNSIATDCSTFEIRKTRATFIRKLTVQPSASLRCRRKFNRP